ncbi:MAG: hypothetical protein HY903_00025 [Deltaproteobacteria bacterium]|nr:hypothetical protein [Deltaproteobacteria bacterium]
MQVRLHSVLSIVTMLSTATPAIAQDEAAAPAPAPEEKKAEEGAPPAPSAEEQQALEADMEAAKKKIAEEQQAAETPAETPAFEEIKAAPVHDTGAAAEGTPTATGETALQARLSGTEGLDTGRPYGALVILDHSIGTGTFMNDGTLRSSRAYVAQSWDIRPHYVFDFKGIKLKANGRFLFEYEYTTPDTSPARRFKPLDTTLQVGAPEIYKEPLSEVSFNVALRLLLPTSYESIKVRKQWSALGFTAGAQRFFGPLHVSYSFAMTKYINSQRYASSYRSVCRSSDPCDSVPTGIQDSPAQVAAGFANNSFLISNQFGVDYSITEELSVSYGLLIRNFFRYTADNVNVIDNYTSPNADDGRGRVDQLWPSLSVDYVVDGLVKKVADLPVSLTASLGITSLSPAQTSDNKGIYWPFFYQAFAQDKAANNYGSVFFDITGTY